MATMYWRRPYVLPVEGSLVFFIVHYHRCGAGLSLELSGGYFSTCTVFHVIHVT